MDIKKRQQRVALITVLAILVLDQVTKYLVKTNMRLGESFSVIGEWFMIHFVENPGMAYGFEFAGDYGKIFLSLFRIIAVIALFFFLKKSIKKGISTGVVVCIALIMAGAIGNIIDSAFYGLIFSESYVEVATLFPDAGGYSSFLHGNVVDMLYFPMVDATFPSWFPFFGGDNFLFFRPVFNIADSAISVGIFIFILFYRNTFEVKDESKDESKASK